MGARSPHDSTALKWSRMHGFPPAEYSSNMERLLPTPRDVSAVTWPPVSYWFLKSCNNTASCNIEHLSSRTYCDATTNISPTAEYSFALFNGKKKKILFFLIYYLLGSVLSKLAHILLRASKRIRYGTNICVL